MVSNTCILYQKKNKCHQSGHFIDLILLYKILVSIVIFYICHFKLNKQNMSLVMSWADRQNSANVRESIELSRVLIRELFLKRNEK